MIIPFNRPHLTGRELSYLQEAHARAHLSGGGKFTALCQGWLEGEIGASKALLTHSCTAALEMAALLANVGVGDEIIMPSFTFVSTANAFVLRGATPVFVDVREDTLNIDERLIREAITSRTRAIAVVHYAGVACEMGAILDLAAEHGLLVIEDAAQGVMSSYSGRALGSLGQLGAVSFHETKNVMSGEGGALLVNDPSLIERAEILWEKGTDRRKMFRGEVDRYTWLDVGSSFLPSELIAAFLWAQLEDAKAITEQRLALWTRYHAAFECLEDAGLARRPRVPAECIQNAHLYYLMLQDAKARDGLIEHLKRDEIYALFHYVPLHSSPAGRRFGRVSGAMTVTDSISARLVRLPLWLGLEDSQLEVIQAVKLALGLGDA
jgi:dTDP-4-amino-4,6-dideoxygalactose transaminase